jgi:hypothetical protein
MVRTLMLATLLAMTPAAASATTIMFTGVFIDEGQPSTISLTLTASILPPINGPTVVSASLTGTLTDATGNGVSITPTVADSSGDADGVAEILLALAGDGVSFVNLGVDVGPASSTEGAYGPFTAGPQAGPAGSFTFLRAQLSFMLSGGGDSASLTGVVTIEPAPVVPLPAAVWLLVAGLPLAMLRRRSH